MSAFVAGSASAVAGFASNTLPHRGGRPLRILSMEVLDSCSAAICDTCSNGSEEVDSKSTSSSSSCSSYQLCDIGANLCDDMFSGTYNDKKRHPNDLLLILQRARAMNVSKIICTAGSVEDSKLTLKLLRTPVPLRWGTLPLSPSIEDLPVVAAERETWTKAETNIETEKGVRAETGTDTDGGGEGPSTPLGEQYGLHMTVGVHPTRADLFLPSDDTNDGDGDVADGKRTGSKVLDAMLSIIVDANSSSSRKVVVAVGECGLDYARLQFCSKEKQLSGFLKQLQLAAHPLVDLPLFLHSRDTEGDFLRIMQDNYHLYARRGGVVHSFDGTVEEMLALCELGLYIGINGCSLRTDALLHTLVPAIPADRLLLETDAPWCGIKKTHPSYPFILSEIPVTGVKKKEKWEAGYVVKDRNEPMYIHQVAEVVARTRGVSVQELAEQCWINSQKLFFF